MATPAHCLYCFDVLAARLGDRQPLSLARIQELYARQQQQQQQELEEDGAAPATTAAAANGHAQPKLPLFVTWKIKSPSSSSPSDRPDLRGCIGTFDPKPLDVGLSDYAITAGLHDTRFNPIAAHELPQLECSVTLLTDFEPAADALDWTLGKHGLQIDFVYHHRRLGATYLPDVATEQGWTREETVVSLMRKAGWTGRRDEWRKAAASGAMRVTRYRGSKATGSWADYCALLALAAADGGAEGAHGGGK